MVVFVGATFINGDLVGAVSVAFSTSGMAMIGAASIAASLLRTRTSAPEGPA